MLSGNRISLRTHSNLLAVVAALTVLMSGCSSLGPGTVSRDRFDYNTAISDSWKEQTPLNIVKIRYAPAGGTVPWKCV